MRYGYLDTCDETGFKLLSIVPTKITLTSSGYSTFVAHGTRARLGKWLQEFGETEVRLSDPLGNVQPTLTVEVRRLFNLFFSPCLVILRPTTALDLEPGVDQGYSIGQHYGLPLCKKLIVSHEIKLKTIADLLDEMRPTTKQTLCTPVPTSSYQVGKANLTMSQLALLSRRCRPVAQRAPNYSASEFDLTLPPSYNVSQATTLPLPAYTCIT